MTTCYEIKFEVLPSFTIGYIYRYNLKTYSDVFSVMRIKIGKMLILSSSTINFEIKLYSIFQGSYFSYR